MHAFAYTSLALLLLIWGGNWICRQIFRLTGLQPHLDDMDTREDAAVKPANNAGRWIGALERLIIALGIIAHSWEIMAAVIALKTVARFKEMDQRNFAEYFLVGSLFSILWALIITSAWLIYDHQFGIDIRSHVEDWLGLAKPAPG